MTGGLGRESLRQLCQLVRPILHSVPVLELRGVEVQDFHQSRMVAAQGKKALRQERQLRGRQVAQPPRCLPGGGLQQRAASRHVADSKRQLNQLSARTSTQARRHELSGAVIEAANAIAVGAKTFHLGDRQEQLRRVVHRPIRQHGGCCICNGVQGFVYQHVGLRRGRGQAQQRRWRQRSQASRGSATDEGRALLHRGPLHAPLAQSRDRRRHLCQRSYRKQSLQAFGDGARVLATAGSSKQLQDLHRPCGHRCLRLGTPQQFLRASAEALGERGILGFAPGRQHRA
mmetsp:Transcript_11655/g.31287  ORF Transcript_11655/g.31287 Transcript_11655/m.31287 type:complete len:287 (-) Transcript_11655:1649-2509(-)